MSADRSNSGEWRAAMARTVAVVASALVWHGCEGAPATLPRAAPTTHGAETPTEPGARAAKVQDVFTVKQLTSIQTSTASSCYAVNFSYAVPLRSSDVYMPGVGAIPSHGDLAFISCEPDLSITDRAGGSLLARLEFKDATQFMGDDVIALPRPNEFTSAFQTANWNRTGEATFGTFAIGILQDDFQLLSVLRDGDESRIVTTYRILNRDKTVRAAVMVGYPDGTTPISFKVWIKVQERREHTDWRDPTESSTLDAALALLTSLRKRLEQAR